jgi:two-component system chemotaxis response regulator CheY
LAASRPGTGHSARAPIGANHEASMKTCLVVDDSEVVRKVARRIFENLSLETMEAGSGQEGLEICARLMPDAILLDCHIPPMATVEFVSTLRSLPGGDKTVVIYCATENNSSEIARALSAGADDYVMKPFDRESLRAKLAAGGVL